MSAKDIQVGGDHYKNMKIQPMEYILANNIGFAEGSVIKYVSRWRDKNGIDDLKKARHVLDFLIEYQEGELLGGDKTWIEKQYSNPAFQKIMDSLNEFILAGGECYLTEHELISKSPLMIYEWAIMGRTIHLRNNDLHYELDLISGKINPLPF